ncbi:TrkH family potassium uptake protein [Saccharospirillum mangrovi]|uniref:TrkH family potassium uptake protein n=1 Tax=Saccharospirillum mangrovi TaxID=2161747 RepID=UPI000D3D1528|nr:TrkH family potassium uptake protein [Saccharospirillum mangrovi]
MSDLKPALQIASFTVLLWAGFMVVPILWVDWHNDQLVRPLVFSAVLCVFLSLLFFVLGRGQLQRMRPRQMFLVTLFNWGVLSLTGALPLYWGWPDLSFVDALFESVSGLTTTGSTVISGLDRGPRALLVWRSITQWVGGIGIILMAVAVLPFLKVGGMRLFRTESSEWSDIQNNRIARVALMIALAYAVLSLLAFVTYWALGMTAFEAFNHALTSVATGGYSTSDASFGQFKQPSLLWAASVFMLLGGMPFLLFVNSVRERRWLIAKDAQVRLLLKLVVVATLSVTLSRWLAGSDESFGLLLSHSLFNLVSVITTTGYASQDYTLWGGFALLVFGFVMFSGACSGSTSGGIKLFRYQLLALMTREHLFHSLHPKAHFSRLYNQRTVEEGVLVAALAYFFLVMASWFCCSLLLAMTGLDAVTATSAALTALMNIGPGLGAIIGPAGNFSSLNDVAKLLLCVAMLLGRLEFLALIVPFTPGFWRW